VAAQLIWITAWQHQCCGEDFAVGSAVSWNVREPDRAWFARTLGPDLSRQPDAVEGHHADRVDRVVNGTVRSIAAVHCAYDQESGSWISGTTTFTRQDPADRWTTDRGNLKFIGYLVRVTVTPAA
jgi:hypothetical protein